MNTTVKLQEPFSYALWPVIGIGIVVFGYFIYLVTTKIVKVVKRRNESRKQQPQIKKTTDLATVKCRYKKELENIEAELNQGQITVRVAYQKMSACIRHFVYEVTGIKVHKYTLSEIQSLNMPMLSELIQEYYPSEFEKDSVGDFTTSVEKTKEVMERWG